MEGIPRENFAALDHGWSLAGAREESLNLMVPSFLPSFVYSSCSKHFYVLLLCPRYPAGSGILRTSKIRFSLNPHGDYSPVQESGISPIIRLVHMSLPMSHEGMLAAGDLGTCSVLGSKETLPVRWAFTETCRTVGISMAVRWTRGPWTIAIASLPIGASFTPGALPGPVLQLLA